jgi:mRNA-degrading endonuclease RelE of RelBE toxin-antitoxin system
MTSPGDAGPYELDVAAPAARVIADSLPEVVAAAVIEFITGPLLTSPRRVGRELRRELTGTWSARRGTFRVLYRIDEDKHRVMVVRVSHRANVYRP